MITQTYYIGTGALSAMYTLNMIRHSDDPTQTIWFKPNYICNLAAAGNEEAALAKAQVYVETMRQRIGETEDFKIVFAGIEEDACMKRRGRLSVRETCDIETIEAGRFPFGKHKGQNIADAPMSYVLFFADMSGPNSDGRPVTQALAAACMGVALEKGYIELRTQKRIEREEQRKRSEHMGEVGKRQTFEGEIVFSQWYESDIRFGSGYYVTVVLSGSNILKYLGSAKLGTKGDHIKFAATVKEHSVYKDAKETRISRPTKIEKIAA